MYDIAGLTRGASTGAGLGNAFLSHIRAVDAIFQVVRCFDDAEIIHVEGDVNPTRDLEIISDELRLKDMEFLDKALENQKKKTRQGGASKSLEMKKSKEEEEILERVVQWLNDGNDVRKGNWGPKEVGSALLRTLAYPLLSRDHNIPLFMMTSGQMACFKPSSSNAMPNSAALRETIKLF